jgi:bacterioferritin (cytochrome b1)
MTLNDMIALLNGDLMNEWKHLRFYLANASLMTGLHAHEYKEFLLKAAEGEMGHVVAFQDLIIGLGGVPTTDSNPFLTTSDPTEVVKLALAMEDEVVKNYVQRQDDARKLATTDPVNGGWIDVFMDGQIQDSREDADHLRQILKGIK